MISAEREKAAVLIAKDGTASDEPASEWYAAAAGPRIKAEGLTKRFAKTLAVDDIDFEIPAGSFTALLGGNGAGKTTTIAMLLGLVSPTAGNIEILGDCIFDKSKPCDAESSLAGRLLTSHLWRPFRVSPLPPALVFC